MLITMTLFEQKYSVCYGALILVFFIRVNLSNGVGIHHPAIVFRVETHGLDIDLVYTLRLGR